VVSLSLPAAATTTTLLSSASWMAARSAGVLPASSDRLMTLAPSSTASVIAVTIAAFEMPVSAFATLMERMLACGATPLKVTPSCGAAAMMLATAVPWPTQSAPLGAPKDPPDRSGPVVTRLPNCGFASTPLSMTATVTPAPWVLPHTLEKLSACCAHGMVAGAAAAWMSGQSAVGVGSWSAVAAWAAGAAVNARAARHGVISIVTSFDVPRTGTYLRQYRRLRMPLPMNTGDPRFTLTAGTT
jgi:hypothetical protein